MKDIEETEIFNMKKNDSFNKPQYSELEIK